MHLIIKNQEILFNLWLPFYYEMEANEHLALKNEVLSIYQKNHNGLTAVWKKHVERDTRNRTVSLIFEGNILCYFDYLYNYNDFMIDEIIEAIKLYIPITLTDVITH